MSKKLSKEIREWIVLIVIVSVLAVTGWWRNVAGFLQGVLLETGIRQPSKVEDVRQANYDFQVVNVGGRTINFSEFKDKTVFINLWATWCPPCIAEMPDIHDLYKKMGDDVEFVMISVDSDQEKAVSFMEKKKFEFPVYFLKSNLPSEFETGSIPTTFVISPNGEIVVEEHGLAKYDTKKFRDFLLGLSQSQVTS